MNDDKIDQRYFPTEEELAVLIPKLKEYFTHPERSNERKTVVNQTYESVVDFNKDHWTAPKIRLWFNNNKNIYMGKDPRRIPTPILKPDKLVDPNLDCKIVIAPTPVNAPSPSPSPSFALYQKESGQIKMNFLTAPLLNKTDFRAFPASMNFNTTNKKDDDNDDCDFPDVPEMNSEMLDEFKFENYNALKAMYAAIRKIESKPNETRVLFQERAEKRMTEILTQMKDIMNVKDICSNDATCKLLRTYGSNKIIRQYSSTTGSYADDKLTSKQATVEFEETSLNIFIPIMKRKQFSPSKSVSKNLSFLLRGECSIEETNLPTIIECCSISSKGEVAYVYLNSLKRSHVLSYNGNEAPTGFFKDASSMFFDNINNHIFVAGDCRIKCFCADDLTCVDTFLASGTSCIPSSCLTLRYASDRTDLVMGSEGIVALWNVTAMQKPSKQNLCKNSGNEDLAKSQGLDLSQIEWSRGRPPEYSFKPEEVLQKVTSICAIDDYIAIASSKHHSIHLLDKEFKSVSGRLVGHVGGITKLIPLGNNCLVSASKDCTMKIWNINKMIAIHHIIRHAGPISTVSNGNYENVEFLFSGGKDFAVRGWNVSQNFSTFEIRLKKDEPSIPMEMKFISETKTLVAVTISKIFKYVFKSD